MKDNIINGLCRVLLCLVYKRIRISTFVEVFIIRGLPTRTQRRRFRNLSRVIEDFENCIGQPLYTDSFTLNNSRKFRAFLESRKLKTNTIRTMASGITTILNIARAEGFRVKNSIPEVLPKRESTVQVYLTDDEILRIYHADRFMKLNREQEYVKDTFLIGCYTALRFCDLITIIPEDVIDDKVIYKWNQKTRSFVAIPLHPIARELLKKYGNRIPIGKNSMQYYNMEIKNICRKAGITQNVSVEYTQGGETVRKIVPKYLLVASHTARRTAITNLYLKGVPLLSIMAISGHRNLMSLLLYIRITTEVHAKILHDMLYPTDCVATRLADSRPKILSDLNQIQLDYIYQMKRVS